MIHEGSSSVKIIPPHNASKTAPITFRGHIAIASSYQIKVSQYQYRQRKRECDKFIFGHDFESAAYVRFQFEFLQYPR